MTQLFSDAYRQHLGASSRLAVKSNEELWPAYALLKHLDETLTDAENVQLVGVGGRSGGGLVAEFTLKSKPGLFFGGYIEDDSVWDLFGINEGRQGRKIIDWSILVGREPLKTEHDEEEDYFWVNVEKTVTIKQTVNELYSLV